MSAATMNGHGPGETIEQRVEVPTTTRSDWQTDQEVRWCPGCGDYSILAAMQLAMPGMGIRREDTVVISGIGCAARFPYYMDTYGVHSIHGRAPAMATGLALARPDLSVFVVGGDGDLLSIGGNHLLHALRRNVNLTILLFNNRIYGLTKGQYSPTSEVGKHTKSTPFGSVDAPLHPLAVALGAGATFVARTHDMDRQGMEAIFQRAHAHRGAAFVEILQNCNVFNDGAFTDVTGKSARDEMLIPLTHGEPVRFGEDGHAGIQVDLDGGRVVEVDEVGVESLYVHDEQRSSPTAAMALALMAPEPTEPMPMGVFRDVQLPMHHTEEVAGPGTRDDLAALLNSGTTWTVDPEVG